jgi:hypothetical protein
MIKSLNNITTFGNFIKCQSEVNAIYNPIII